MYATPFAVPLKLMLPMTRENLFTLEDISLLRRIDITEMWTMEYVLSMWLLFANEEPSYVYEYVVDHVTDTMFVFDNSEADNLRQKRFAEEADEYVALLWKIFKSYAVYMRGIVDDVPAGMGLETITLDTEDTRHGFSVIAMNLDSGSWVDDMRFRDAEMITERNKSTAIKPPV